MPPPRDGHAEQEERARQKALRLLAVRARSRKELLQRLLAAGHSRTVAGSVLQRLTAAGLIDDRRFAGDRARAAGQGRGWGPRKICADLLQRGIPPELIVEAVAQAYGNDSPREVMIRLVKKRFGEEALSAEADLRLWGKARRFLFGRGFEADEIDSLFAD